MTIGTRPGLPRGRTDTDARCKLFLLPAKVVHVTEAIFRSTSNVDGPPGYRERSGQPVTIIGEVGSDVDPAVEEEDVATIYLVRFPDGVETEAFADELEPSPASQHA